MKRFVFFLAGLLTVVPLGAKVRLPSIIGDNMVLQQQSEVPVWGKAAPGKKVTVKASWGRSASAVAKPDSTWSVRIPTPSAGGPYSITITDGNPVTLRNVLVGEVWLCSGQSNMEMPVRGYSAQPVEGSLDALLAADPETPIRLARVPRQSSLEIRWDCRLDGWNLHSPEAVSGASATAYFFGKYLYESLHVPIGLIMSDWGGSAIEPWMSRDALESAGYDLTDMEKNYPQKPHRTPTALYNAMLAPLMPYAVKGFIWYQGETNRPGNEPGKIYSELQTAFGRMLRRCFGDGTDAQPFYFVQISPYNYDNPAGVESGYLYEQQARTLDMLPHSGMVVTNDIGDIDVIHPAKKPEVGKRLALLALQNEYGRLQGIDLRYPMLGSMKMEGFKAVLTFDVGPGGLAPLNKDIAGFEVAGADKVFRPATARVCPSERNKVEVWSGQVREIKAVRYCFRNYQVGTLTNVFGLPASPFRTDDW